MGYWQCSRLNDYLDFKYRLMRTVNLLYVAKWCKSAAAWKNLQYELLVWITLRFCGKIAAF